MKYYYVYILKCADNSYYTGVSNNLERRVIEHQNGDDPKSYTFNKRPVNLVWYEYYNDINQAVEKEKQIKGWSRKKKEALIKGDYDALIEFSKNTLRQAQGDNKKIVITGPESTGKSTLTASLAKHYNVNWVKEYAREYLRKLKQAYEFDDVLEMAKIQLKKEQEAEKTITRKIFLDTDLTVFKVWLKEKYNTEVDWIENEIKQSSNKIFFVCDIDIPWQTDPLREHPNLEDRQRLFDRYIQIMQQNKFNYHIISGDEDARLKKCIDIVDNLN